MGGPVESQVRQDARSAVISRVPTGMIDSDRLREGALVLGIELSGEQLNRFDAFAAAIAAKNRVMNLTRVPVEEFVPRHFLDSLTLAFTFAKAFGRSLEAAGPGSLLDVGPGAGLPGIALKIAFPELGLTLLDASRKTAQFLSETCEMLGLGGARVIAERAEVVGRRSEYRESFDLVVARALAPMIPLCELTVPLVRPGGVALLTKSASARQEIAQAIPAIQRFGGKLVLSPEIEVPTTDARRIIAVVEKIGGTPERFPRTWAEIKRGEGR